VLSSDRAPENKNQAGKKDGRGMRTILAFAAAFAFASCLHAQGSCGAELKPLQPPTLICTGGSPSAACICNDYGQNCHWAWGCGDSSAAPASNQGTTNPGIILQANPAPPATMLQMPLDAARQAEQLRQLQLQNEQLRLRNEQLSRQDRPGIPAGFNDVSMYSFSKLNGLAWLRMDATTRLIYLHGLSEGMTAITLAATVSDHPVGTPSNPDLGLRYFPAKANTPEITAALDRFYQDPANSLITVLTALRIAAMKFNGAAQTALDSEVYRARQEVLSSPEHSAANNPVK